MTNIEQFILQDDENVVYVGDKETKVYYSAILDQAQRYNSIIVKARGRMISKVADVVLLFNRTAKFWNISIIILHTEQISEDYVSVISILLRRLES